MKDSVIVEIRCGEGGAHAKLLVKQQANVYKRYGDLESL